MRLSIRNLAALSGGLITLVVVSNIVIDTIGNRKDVALRERAQQIAALSDLGLQSIYPLTQERLVTQIGMTLAGELPKELEAILKVQRQRADAGIEAYLRATEAAADIPDAAKAAEHVRTLKARLVDIRARADKGFTTRLVQRGTDMVTTSADLTQAILAAHDAMGRVADAGAIAAAGIQAQSESTTLAWQIREYEATVLGLIATAVAHERPMDQADQKLAGEASGRAAAAYEGLIRLRAALDATTQADTQGLEALFEKNQKQKIEMLRAAESGFYPTDFAPYFAEALQFIAAMEGQTRKFAEGSSTAARASVNAGMQRMILELAVGSLVLLINGFVMWLLLFRIARRLNSLNGAMTRLAGGDKDVAIANTADHDEIGDMARALVVFKENADKVQAMSLEQSAQREAVRQARRAEMGDLASEFEADVGAIADALGASAAEMTEAARSVLAAADSTGQRAASILASAEQASSLAGGVAAATEEMTSSIGEIGRQVQTSAERTSQAVKDAATAQEQMASLSTAVSRIGNVVDLINSIAGQTNLLALNATIEAARAGESGKGFAVVANEVKALAAQTAKATAEIAQQIASVQTATSSTVATIRQITDAISELEGIAATIAAAVEEQHAVTPTSPATSRAPPR